MLVFALFSIGFAALSSQIVILRELLIVFYGNEINLGLMLGIWLFTGTAGSMISGKILQKSKTNNLNFFNCLQISTAIYLPLSIYLIRVLPKILKLFPGEITNEVSVLISSIPLMLPLSGMLGALFAFGCAVYKKKQGISRVSYTYILESIGAFAGGICTIFILLPYFDSFQITFLLSILMLIPVFFLNPLLIAKLAVTGLIIADLFLFKNAPALNKTMISQIFNNYNVRLYKNTHYQNLLVLQDEDSMSLYTSGIYNFTVPDPSTAETAAHLPLTQHETPKKVLLIGGGLSGVTKEILKHPIDELVYLEIDPQVIKYLKEFFPVPDDDRFKILISDARQWFHKSHDKFDIIILQLPPPNTILINRYYTREFFIQVSSHLNSGGIFSFSMPSQPNYLSHEHRMFFSSLKTTLEDVFAEVLITPGETAYFLAAPDKDTLTSDWKKMLERIRTKGIQTEYFREYYLFSELSQMRFDDLSLQLRLGGKMRLNKDFYPVSHFYNSILWSSQFKYSFKELLRYLNVSNIFIIFLFLLIIFLFPIYTRKEFYSYKLFAVVAVTGFAEISFQIITILIYQIFYGSVFWKMSLIFTSFMLGLILGSYTITVLMEKTEPKHSWLVKNQLMIIFYPLLLILAMISLRNINAGKYILSLLPFIPGFLGGIQFPLACALFHNKTRKTSGEIGGLFYGADLLGSFTGSLAISLLIIPVAGIIPAIIILTLLGIGSLILLIFK